MRAGALLLGCAALCIAVRPALADAPIAGTNLNTPESAAASIIGGSTQGVIHAGSPSQLGISLLNGLDGSGNLKAGTGAELAPWPVFGWITPTEYRDDPVMRILGRTTLSFATAKGTGGGAAPVSLGFGISTSLIDRTDPMLDGDVSQLDPATDNGCVQAIDNEINTRTTQAERTINTATAEGVAKLSKAIADIDQSQTPLLKKCFKKGAIRLWNRSAWNVSAAYAVTTPTGALNLLKA